MNDKKLDELIEALKTKGFGQKALTALCDKIEALEKATADYDKAKAKHKKEYLALSAETTKLEKLHSDIEGKQDKADKAESCAETKCLQAETMADALGKQIADFKSFEKKTKASCRRKENETSKTLMEAETLRAEGAELKGEYEAKIDVLKAAING